jgi:hypothetical protein
MIIPHGTRVGVRWTRSNGSRKFYYGIYINDNLGQYAIYDDGTTTNFTIKNEEDIDNAIKCGSLIVANDKINCFDIISKYWKKINPTIKITKLQVLSNSYDGLRGCIYYPAENVYLCIVRKERLTSSNIHLLSGLNILTGKRHTIEYGTSYNNSDIVIYNAKIPKIGDIINRYYFKSYIYNYNMLISLGLTKHVSHGILDHELWYLDEGYKYNPQ